MSKLIEDIKYLAREIGPRPAGTEEEQQAALYVTDKFQQEVGFTTAIEDFSCVNDTEFKRAILSALTALFACLAVLFPSLTIAAFVLVALTAVLYSLEMFDRSILSRVMARGASQNVVAKYQPKGPNETERALKRKIVLLAHYDTTRSVPRLVSRIESLGLPLGLIYVVANTTVAFMLLIRVFILGSGGVGLSVVNIIAIIAAIVCLIPLVSALAIRFSSYNEGAVNNASGTAALIEIARRISKGLASEEELSKAAVAAEANPAIHGEQAARQAGLVPEGAQIHYEADQVAYPAEVGEQSDEERILSAKAALAAFTGQPIEQHLYSSVADNLVGSYATEPQEEPGASELAASSEEGAQEEDIQASGAQGKDSMHGGSDLSVTGQKAHDFSNVPGVQPTPKEDKEDKPAQASGFENAPAWFVAAQQNAHKSDNYDADKTPQVKRSSYIEAMEKTERDLAKREEQHKAAAQQTRVAEARARLEGYNKKAEATAQASDDSKAVMSSEDKQDLSGRQTALEAATPAGTLATSQKEAATSNPAAKPSEQSSATKPSQEAASAGAAPAQSAPRTPEQASRISSLPEIKVEKTPSEKPKKDPSRSGILRKLRTNIPSLSGLITPVPDSSQGADQVPAKKATKARPSVAEKDNELTNTPQEWLNVDEDFDARSVGRARGSWESFRENQSDNTQAAQHTDAEHSQEQNSESAGEQNTPNWEGGAYSKDDLNKVQSAPGQTLDPSAKELVEAAETADNLAQSLETDSSLATPEDKKMKELEQIYHFRNPHFNSEIWFVAVGADQVSHDGVQALLAEHAKELHGALFIEIESLGAGSLACASEEGSIRKTTTSSRSKRIIRNATATTGMSPSSVSLVGTDSISSTLQKAGFQAMHLFGAEEGRPALKGNIDDAVDSVDEQILEEQVNFIYEILKD